MRCSRGGSSPVRGDGLHVEHEPHLRVLLAEEVSMPECDPVSITRLMAESGRRARFSNLREHRPERGEEALQ
jgi:hypothetical protein